MRALTTIAVVAVAVTAAGAAQASPSVRIKDAVARVVVIPENRSDVKVEFISTNPQLPLTVRQTDDGAVVIDGDLRMNRINNCGRRDGKISVRVRGVGEVGYDNFPQIAVRAPMDAKVQAGGAVFGDIGRSNSLELANGGCGDWTVANTRGKLEIALGGSGDIKAGSAGSLEVSLGGSGNVRTQAVAGDMEVSIAGSGDVSVARLEGKLEANIAGSGDIDIAGGRARSIEANIVGSGDIDFRGEAESVEVNLMGSGDVRVARVTGPIEKHVVGSGSVIVGGR